MRILVIVEKSRTGYSAYSPDFEGCVAAGATGDEVEQAMREAMALHVRGLREEGHRVTEPRTYATYVEVAR